MMKYFRFLKLHMPRRLLVLALSLALMTGAAAPVYGLSGEESIERVFDHIMVNQDTILSHVKIPQAVDGFTDEQVIQYFVEVAMYGEFEGYRGYLLRYETPIKYCFMGSPEVADKETVRALAAALNEIPGFPGLTETDTYEDADMTVMFSSMAEYEDFFDLNVPAGSWGYASLWHYTKDYQRGQITDTNIWISNDAWPRRDRNSVICEEFVQGLGLLNDPDYGYSSIFDQHRNDVDWPSALDWAMVRILYAPIMDRFANEAQVRQLAQMVLDGMK